MIKPDEIRSVEFDMSVLGGYKREAVDSFIDEVIRDYEKLYEENIDLAKKLKVCISKIEEYQKDERFLKAAIINAEKLNETSLREIEAKEKEIEQAAKEKADILVEKAKIEAENIVKTARTEASDAIRKCEIDAAEKIAKINAEISIENDKLVALKKEVSEFKDMILKLYKSHLESLSKIPEYTYSAPVKETVKEESKEEIPEEQKKAEEVEIDKNTVEDLADDEQVESASIHDSQSEKTAEFVLDKKKSGKKKGDFDEHFKFQGLKFGTDFDVENEE